MIYDESIKILESTLDFWGNLTNEEKDIITEHSDLVTYKKGSIIHCGDLDCVGVLFIKTGTIRIYMVSDEGKEITLYKLLDNNICILSASCILDAISFDVYIDTETDCQIIKICSTAYKKIMSENIYVENFTYKLATKRFSDVMWAMEQILFTSFDKRLASFLLDEVNVSSTDTLHITHDYIAKNLGTAREVVSRMLKYFSTEGLVVLGRGEITITNKEQLIKMVQD